MLATPIEVKKAYKEGTHKKNYRFVVLNDDGTEDFTIDNDTLVAESVHIDERMASGSELKFGLCEGSSLEFQYFDHENINGRHIQAFIDIDYGDDDPYSTPLGFFTVKECPRQFSTGIYKVTAYNKLQSEYLDQKANDLLLADFDGDGSVSLTVYDIQKLLLANYEVIEKETISQPVTINPSVLSYSTDISNYYFSADRGIDTPLSAKEYDEIYTPASGSQAGYGTKLTLIHEIVPGIATTTSGQYWEIDYLRGAIEDWVKSYIEYATDIIYNAKFMKTSTGPLYTRDEIETLLRGKSFVRITIDYSTTYLLTKDPESTWAAVNKLIHSGAHTIRFTIPKALGFALTSDVSIKKMMVSYIEPFSYSYKKSNGTIEEKTATPSVFFSNNIRYDADLETIFGINTLSLNESEKVTLTINDIPDFTLRELMSANYETVCQYGQLDRVTDLFSGVELNGGGLYPAETLYPADSLYPNSNTGGQGIHPYPSEYSQLWTDTMGEQSFRYLIITYKTLDENNNEVDAVLQRTVNADGTTDYNMSDNWLFRNLVWTAADVGDYADAMVTKMQGIKWFPFEMWAAGLPYVETGDAIEITDRDGNTHNSYILQRQLQGIQNLQDTYVNGELDIF